MTVGAETSSRESIDEQGPGRRGLFVVVLGFVGLPLLIVAALSLVATLRYRSAVGDLHDELAAVELSTAERLDHRFDRCHVVGPASLTEFAPVAGASEVDVVAELRIELADRGFEALSPTAYTRSQSWHRTRGDDLDADVVTLSRAGDGGALLIVADVLDGDMVFCPPA